MGRSPLPSPPVQVANSSSTSFSHLSRQIDELNSISFSPTPSFADSFNTAYTSPSKADTEAEVSQDILSPAPPQSLRKSFSVDSFVQYGREAHPPAKPRSSRVNKDSSLDPPRGFLPRGSSGGVKGDAQLERKRGYSVSSTTDGAYSHNVDSDVERSELPFDRYRHPSLKGQDQSRHPVPGGELPLPSRTPTLSSTPSMSSIVSTSTSSNTLEDIPRQHALSSLQTFSGRHIPSPAIVPGRLRSGSLGTYTNSSRRMQINTQVSNFDTFRPNVAVTLAVIGAPGCGKSTVIRKGLRNHNISEPVVLPATSSLRYTRRTGRIGRGESSPEGYLHVVEVDVPTELIDSKNPFWPEGLSAIDGVIICYDSSNKASFKPVESLLRGCCAVKVPIIVLACKSDLERQVEPERALEVLQRYDVGLVEVGKTQEQGKERMRRTFGWLLMSVFRDRRTHRNDFDANYRNPASPDLIASPPPWEGSRTTTPTASPSVKSISPDQLTASPSTYSPLPSTTHANFASPPARARSTGDLLYESAKSARAWEASVSVSEAARREKNSADSLQDSKANIVDNAEETQEHQKESKGKEPRPAQWATLDELLDKLLFLAVSGDDPSYITHFLLTYRRFASPRSVLLAMQKRMRQLDNSSGDPMFACFAQMRICHLLEGWIRDYPYDFAVRGAAGALSALIKSIISKTYLLHYGSEFLPFLELLPNLVDQDAAWALKVDNTTGESDDSYSLLEEDDEAQTDGESTSNSPTTTREQTMPPLPPLPSRERKPSLPLPLLASGSASNTGQNEVADTSEKQQIKDLVRLAQEISTLDPGEIAQEITRVEVKLFLDIQPRHWLYYTFVSGKKDEKEPITAFNSVSNHLANWVISLILCHEKTKARAKQVEKFVDIARELRAINNYSALRAFVAGINNSTYTSDEIMEQFKLKSPEQAKNLQSWDILLQHIRSHCAYRLALKNTMGPCIPALEVHMSDLIKAHVGNEDRHPSDPTKIHWGKFNMMGRFISSTAQCQSQCRNSSAYNFVERNAIKELFVKRPVMNDEMQKSRIPTEAHFDDYRPAAHSILNQPRDMAILRKLFSFGN